MTEVSHDQAAAELAAYANHSLPAARRDAVARHVESCAACAADLDAWRTIATAVRADLAQLMQLIAVLAPAHREALLLFFVDDLSYAEMAQVLEVPVGTVKSRLSNARRALAGLLADTEGAES